MRSTLLACCLVAIAGAAAAQEAPASGQAAEGVTGETPRPSVTLNIDPDLLGVSMNRIRLRYLRTSQFGQTFDPERLRLASYVNVVAVAPMLELFGPDAKKELTSHAVPFGIPTHQGIFELTTPQEYRRPTFDLTALTNWLTNSFNKKGGGE